MYFLKHVSKETFEMYFKLTIYVQFIDVALQYIIEVNFVK